MKTRIQLIHLLSASILLLSGCTKKNTSMTPEKKAAAAAQKAADTKKDTKPQTPAPAPLETPVAQPAPSKGEAETATPVADSQPVTIDDSSSTQTESTASVPIAVTNPPVSAPAATTPNPTPTAESAGLAAADDVPTNFEKCLTDNVVAAVSTLKAIAPREPTPSNFLTIKNLLLKMCALKLGEKAKDLDLNQFETSKIIVTEAMRSFPQFEPTVKFFNVIEANPAIAQEQKENIYKSYGSGGEISSKDIHFYGKLEGSKASPNVISYLITSATGTRTTRVFTASKEIKKTVSDLKSSPKTTNRYTFDFTPTQNNTYGLNISNGEAKIVVSVTFVKGDIKTLRERKAVTVALTSESWSKVQEEHLRRLISSEAKELISMPFSLEREQTNMALVRTCSLDADNIACTDPDFTSRAVVKSSAKTLDKTSAKAQ